MDDNTRSHRAVVFDDYLKNEGFICMENPGKRPNLIPLKIFGKTSAVLCVNVSHPTLIEFETSVHEE